MFRISEDQYNSFDRIYREKFFGDLEQYILGEFPNIESEERSKLMFDCRNTCESLNIRKKDGIFAFYILSFIEGVPVNRSSEYQTAHKRYILLGYNSEQLPIDILEAMY